MAWVLLVLAIAGETIATLALKASDGFSKLWASVLVVVGYGAAFVLMAFALRTLQVGVSYAIWSGLGTIGAAIGGALLFSERLTPVGVAGIAVVVVGIVMITVAQGRG
jgi:small multidrug resistance pump